MSLIVSKIMDMVEFLQNNLLLQPKNEPTIGTLMKESRSRDKNKLVRSCQFMHREFLVRISKVIIHLQVWLVIYVFKTDMNIFFISHEHDIAIG